MPWTRFMDMNSGGGTKEPWDYIYIEAPEEEARAIFIGRFGHDPSDVACECCGPNYSVCEDETLEQSTGYERGCGFDEDRYIEEPRKGFGGYVYDYTPLDEYLKRDDVLVIRAADIAHA